MQTVPLLGYAPDLDPTQPGVFSYCKGMEATNRGGWRLQRRADFSVNTLSGDPTDGALLHKTDGVTRVYAVFGSAVYEGVTGQNVGSVGSTNLCSFCQYGDYTLVAQISSSQVPQTVRIRDTSTNNAFADSAATGIPKAAICVTAGPPTSPRVILLNYKDGSTTYNDGWWSSHQGGPTLDWTPDIATGAMNGRLLGAGNLMCGIAYRDDCIAFSNSEMWRGVFVDPPYTWQWQRVSNQHGCLGPGAATVLNGILYFLAPNGLFEYDGTYPRRMSVPIQSDFTHYYLFSGGGYSRSRLAPDRWGKLLVSIRASYAGAGGVLPSATYIINLDTRKVGIDGRGIWLPLGDGWSASPGLTGGTGRIEQDQLSPYHAALSDGWGLGLSYIGSNKGDTLLRDIIPRFNTAPSTFSWNDYYGPSQSEVLSNNTGATTISASPWRASGGTGVMLKSARWHAPRLFFSSTGDLIDPEVMDVMIDTKASGNA